ncbi:Fc.00g111010.m01.CDS01 [Cosmosporella sp. VM-42]
MSSVASLSNGLLTPTTGDMMTLDTPTGDDDLWPTDQDVAELALMTYNPPEPLSWDRRSLKRLPPSAMPAKLVGEGAANAVFEVAFPQGDPATSIFKGWLLRVAKAPTNGSPPRYNYIKQQEHYVRKVKFTLGSDRVVRHELVVVRNSNIIRKLNNFLASIDHERKEKFRGSFVAASNWGFLVEDMRPENPDEAILIEFKPKWLAQSPSAPCEAIRCRTCAMEFSNYLKKSTPNGSKPDMKPCPLSLAGERVSVLSCDPWRIAPKLEGKMPDHWNLFDSITRHQIIKDLRAAQIAADSYGPLNTARDDLNFSWAMTIRDCTCFVQISLDATIEEPLKIRLGDFDFKDPLIKFDHWQKTERNLIAEGFYTADWILSGGTYYHPPTICLLELAPRTFKPSIIHLHHPDSANMDEKNHWISNLKRTSFDLFVIRTDAPEHGWDARLKPYSKEPSTYKDLNEYIDRPKPPYVHTSERKEHLLT